MILTFTPMRSDADIDISRKGDSLRINGRTYDFGDLPEGAVLPQDAVDCPELGSDVTRVDGVIRLTLILPHGANPPQERAFPRPMVLRRNGPVALPPFDLVADELIQEGTSDGN